MKICDRFCTAGSRHDKVHRVRYQEDAKDPKDPKDPKDIALNILSSMSVDDVHHRFLISTDLSGDGFRMLDCGQGPASVRRCFRCPGRISDKPG